MNSTGTAASAPIPFKPDGDAALPSGPQWGLAVVLCLTALALIVWRLRRRGGSSTRWPRGQGALIDVVEARALGAQTQLIVARYAGRRLLLSVGPAGAQCLRDDADVEAQQS